MTSRLPRLALAALLILSTLTPPTPAQLTLAPGTPPSAQTSRAKHSGPPPLLAMAPSTAAPRGCISLDPLSPEVPGFAPSDVFRHATGCTPVVPWTFSDLGIPPGGNVDALADFRDSFPMAGPAGESWPPRDREVVIGFSVDRMSHGIGVVGREAVTDGAAGDTFGRRLAPGMAPTFLVSDSECLTPLPGLQSDIDALVISREVRYPLYLSVDPPTAGAMGVGPADILLVPAPGVGPFVVLTAADLGLLPGDDVNALAVGKEGLVFSLKRGSPSTGLFPAVGSGGIYAPGPVPWALASQCGLFPSDDLDALAIVEPRSQHRGPIVPGAAVMESDPLSGATGATSLWRAFALPPSSGGFHVSDVEFGVDLIETYGFDVTVALWGSNTLDPAGLKFPIVEIELPLLGTPAPPPLAQPAPPLAPEIELKPLDLVGLHHATFDDVLCPAPVLWVELRIPESPGFPTDGRFLWAGTPQESAPTYLSGASTGGAILDLDALGHPDSGLALSLCGFLDDAVQLLQGKAKQNQPLINIVVGVDFNQQFQPFSTFGGLGLGPCFPLWGGTCLDLLAPTPLPLDLGGPFGFGSFTLPIPPDPQLAGLDLGMQAVVIEGPGGADSKKSNATVQEVK